MVSTMVRTLFMVAICGGSSATNCGTTVSILFRSGTSSSSFSLSLSTPSIELYKDLVAQQTGML